MVRDQKKKPYWHGVQSANLRSQPQIRTKVMSSDRELPPAGDPSCDMYYEEESEDSGIRGGFVPRPLLSMPQQTALMSNIPFNQQQSVIYGPIYSGCLNMDTIQKMNGQGFSITPKAYCSGTYGSLGCQIRTGDFVFSFVPAISAPDYIARRLCLPKYANENGKNALACNNLAGRIIYMLCDRPIFIFGDLSMTQAGGVTSENIQNVAVIFTWDCMGGGVNSDFNRYTTGPLTTNQTIGTDLYTAIIGMIPTTPIVPPGASAYFIPTVNMGSVFYAGTTFATNMTCTCINILPPDFNCAI